MTEPKCPFRSCGKPMPDTAVVCKDSGSDLRELLHKTAKIADEPEVTIARLDRITRNFPAQPDPLPWESHGESLESFPLPINLHASEAHGRAVGALLVWAARVAEERGDVVPAGDAGLMRWLARQVDWLRYRPEAPDAFVEISVACETIERIVDRHPGDVLIGRCPCCTWVYAPRGALEATCPGCGTTHRTDALRANVRAVLEDRLMTAAEVATAAVLLDIGAKDRRGVYKLVDQWVRRGKLAPHSDIAGAPAFRFGDVLLLLVAAYKPPA